MKHSKVHFHLFAGFLLLCFTLSDGISQNRMDSLYDDPCGYDTMKLTYLKAQLGDHWGYGYTDLSEDLDTWNLNPFVTANNIGLSVQGRDIPMLTIKNKEEDSVKFRIAIHARTHPGEVQSTHVTNEIINELLSGSSLSDSLLDVCVFSIIPMINPDGVELEYSRLNANGVDLESNWNTYPHQPEVQALKDTYMALMNSDLPIQVFLNMHSAVQCNRFFVYHDSVGTSPSYAAYERLFITSIRNYWPEGIQDWDHYVSWKTGTPLYYPESWFWIYYGESVMALTYEDMNCTTAGEYDKTAKAILSGMNTYLEQVEPLGVNEDVPLRKLKIYPNPVRQNAYVNIILPQPDQSYQIEVLDITGQKMAVDVNNHGPAYLSVNTSGIKSGIYIVRLIQFGFEYNGLIIIQ